MDEANWEVLTRARVSPRYGAVCRILQRPYDEPKLWRHGCGWLLLNACERPQDEPKPWSEAVAGVWGGKHLKILG
eukprot:scaffold127222_cov32-Tisochrysis_lutea.AAC.1